MSSRGVFSVTPTCYLPDSEARHWSWPRLGSASWKKRGWRVKRQTYMLFLRQLKHLETRLGVPLQDIEAALESPEKYYEEFDLYDPAKPDKPPRRVLNVKGLVRLAQERLYRRILLPKLQPSPYSHGGVSGRHIKSNALEHANSTYGFTTDISGFYPSVHYSRVYKLFLQDFGCSPDVARICTRLCTHYHHLALGLVTSPIIADQLMRHVDSRIAGACKSATLVYTRFVDDISISGTYDLAATKSGISSLVVKILTEHGFRVQSKKHLFGRLDAEIAITKLRVREGRIDVRREYVDELTRQLRDAANLANNGGFAGPYYTQTQIRGRVQFVCWVNPGRRRDLWRQYRSIDWNGVHENALARKLQVCRPILKRVDGRLDE